MPFKLSPPNTYLCQSTKLAGKKIMKKETKKQVTAPKVATVAKAVKAEIDPKTGEELITMNIKMYEGDSDDMVKNDDLEKRIRLSLSRFLRSFAEDGIELSTKENVEKFDELTEDPKNWKALSLISRINNLAEICDYLDLRISVTLANSIAGIKQINVEKFFEYNVVTENCYANIDNDINLILGKNSYWGDDGQIVKQGAKLLRSRRIGDCFSIFYDAIDISHDKKLTEWFDNV